MLTDRFGRIHDYLRISLTETCNLRCTYCMPDEFQPQHPHRMTAGEIDALAKIFIDLGVKKIRLTGGEPLIRKDARQIIRNLARYSLPVKGREALKLTITTNGILIHEFLSEFTNANINSVNVSLDSLMPERFEAITRRNYFH